MLQRVQTLYLLGAVILFIIMMCFPMGYLHTVNSQVFPFWTIGVPGKLGFHYTLTIFIILLLSALCELITIFLFKNRVLQMRLTIFNIVLQVGFYIAVAAYLLIFKNDFNATFSVYFTLFLPLVTIFFNIMAFRKIHKDEALIRSLNHLR
jgi:hypothetical protein